MSSKKKACRSGIVTFRILVSVTALLTALSTSLMSICFQFPNAVNATLNTSNSKIVDNGSGETITYKRHYTDDELASAGNALDKQVGQEGTVILKNKNNALPITSGERVSFFGIGAENIITGGTGSGTGTAGNNNLKAALEADGVSVNETLYQWYVSHTPSNYRGSSSSVSGSGNGGVQIDEIPIASVDLSSVSPTDIGVFVVTRVGGEGADIVKDGASTQDFAHYLELNDAEKAVLLQMKEKTSRQIVVINSNNTVGLSFMNDEAYGIDGCVWMPGMGTSGIAGCADAITGKINPSGKTVDTWATNSLSSPALQNFGASQWTNYTDVWAETGSVSAPCDWSYLWNDAYIVEEEGIYVGYKYYETRYEDTILGHGNASGNAGASMGESAWDYDKEVTAPFGYGLSYTTFSQTLNSVTEKVEKDTNEKYYEVNVSVTNTGNVAGKDVVEAYVQQPFTDYDKANSVEKSAIVLGGFAKTDELAPGKSETVTAKILKRDLASYDYKKAKTYLFEAGDYQFAIGDNAHDALKNILSAKGATASAGNGSMVITKNLSSDTSFATSEAGEKVTNELDHGNIDSYYDNINRLSRTDWEKTWPTTPSLTATSAVIEGLQKTTVVPRTDEANKIAAKYPNYQNGSGKGISLVTMRGANFNADAWNDILNELSLEELYTLNCDDFPGTAAIASISKPGNVAMDGPSGHRAMGSSAGHTFPVEVMVAATWNVNLSKKLGELLAEDGLRLGRQGILGPAVNIHRSPYSGRNFEYFSEDGVMSGKLVETEISAYLKVGGEVFIKHFAFNDQETHRFGIATFNSEQAFREIYLKPFEYAFARAKCNGVMMAFNRVGLKTAHGDPALIKKILRGEWGFTGIVTSDNAGNRYSGHEEPIMCKEAGICCWRNPNNSLIKPLYATYAGTDFTFYEALRNCAKYILYTSANDINMNGISTTSKVVSVTPWWVPAEIALVTVFALLTAGCFVGLVLTTEKARKNEEEEAK